MTDREIQDVLELRAVNRGNGYKSIRRHEWGFSVGGLGPERNGAGVYHAVKHSNLTWPGAR